MAGGRHRGKKRRQGGEILRVSVQKKNKSLARIGCCCCLLLLLLKRPFQVEGFSPALREYSTAADTLQYIQLIRYSTVPYRVTAPSARNPLNPLLRPLLSLLFRLFFHLFSDFSNISIPSPSLILIPSSFPLSSHGLFLKHFASSSCFTISSSSTP